MTWSTKIAAGVRWGCLIGIALGLVDTAAAQPSLDSLESRIRQQTAPGAAKPADAAAVPAQEQAPSLPGLPEAVPAPTPAARSANQPYLGVVVDDRNDRGRGLRVLQVASGGPGQRAGLRVQDLITAVAGRQVRQMSDLVDALEPHAPGDTIWLDVLRGLHTQRLRLTLGQRPPPIGAAPVQPGGPPASAPAPEPVPIPPPAERARPALPGAAAAAPDEIILLPPKTEPAAPPAAKPPVPAPPTPQPTADEHSRIERLERRIVELEQRISQLERALAEPARKPGK
jgi:hypothetical protein